MSGRWVSEWRMGEGVVDGRMVNNSKPPPTFSMPLRMDFEVDKIKTMTLK